MFWGKQPLLQQGIILRKCCLLIMVIIMLNHGLLHRSYAVVRLSPVIEAVSHTSIPPAGGFGKLLCNSMMFQYFWWIFTVAHNCCKHPYLCNIISHTLRAKAKKWLLGTYIGTGKRFVTMKTFNNWSIGLKDNYV